MRFSSILQELKPNKYANIGNAEKHWHYLNFAWADNQKLVIKLVIIDYLDCHFCVTFIFNHIRCRDVNKLSRI
ncbi:MAG: hypothetical protein RMY62_003240 [Nostoc sp. ZfuVER08]|nr:hypothetical protein [Nostoc sp. ZfuVER08]